MISVAAFGPGDQGSNPGVLAVSNLILKFIDTNNTNVWYSRKYWDLALCCRW